MLRNSHYQFGAITKCLHGLVALLMIVQFLLIYLRQNLPRSHSLNLPLVYWHKSIGVSLLVLALLFIGWHLINTSPRHPDNLRAWMIRLAALTHAALFSVMFLMPLTGYLMSCASGKPISWFGLFDWPMLLNCNKKLAPLFYQSHVWLSYFTIAFVSLHVFAALWHHIVNKDEVLLRMLPILKKPSKE